MSNIRNTKAFELALGELARIDGVLYKRYDENSCKGLAFMKVDLTNPWERGDIVYFSPSKQVRKVEVMYRPAYGKREAISLAA